MNLHALLSQDITVLTASRRLAHAIRLGYATYAQKQGVSVWRTPRVLPWGAWLRQQHIERRAEEHEISLCARVLTPAQARVLWDDVVASSGLAADLLNPSNAARLAARSWRRLQDYLIPLEQLRSFESPEAQALYAWCIGFEERCESLDAIDEARLSHWAHDSGFVPSERVALAGFDLLSPAMTRLLERWRSHERIVDVEGDHPKAAAVSVVPAEDVQTELELAGRWARDRVLDGATNAGVIVPDLQARREEVRRVFEDVMAPGLRHIDSVHAELPIVIAAPAPLSSYPVVDAALLVLQLAIGDASSAQAGRMLRSPFLGSGSAEHALRAQADVRLRESQRDRWDWYKLEVWAGVTGCVQLQAAARALTSILRSMPPTAAASEWAERFHALWLAIGWPGERSSSSAEHQTLEKLQSVLAELGALGAVTGRMNLRRAVSRFQDLLGDTPFEPETSGAAITVIDAATSAGMQFDALWVAGLDADRWPPAVNPDPLIPLELQRAAGVPECSASSVLRIAAIQLHRWTGSAETVVLSWPERDGDIELDISPLIRNLPRQSPATQPTKSLRRLLFDARPQLELVRDDRAPALPPQSARGGARTIELQSRCPFRAQAELRLRAQPLPRVSLGVEPVDRGAILHRVLADLWGEIRSQERLLQLDENVLAQKVRNSTERHVMQALPTETPHRLRLATLEVDSLARLITRLLSQERSRPAFSIQLAEAAEQYTIGGLSITLRPDRIDLLGSGGELLIDYKLGDSHRPRDWLDVLPGRPRRPQLPLYGLAHGERLRALAYVVLAPGAVEYRGWSDGADIGMGVAPYPSGLRIDLGDPSDWEALLHQWRFALTRLAERYVAGDAAVDPLPQECATCHLASLCRVHERGIVVEIGTDD